ncbi:alpha/beta hydrolase [Rhodococcus sp. NPDC060086]|uniref:alpha/beta hydrolase n=1 Tax=unclassified Rhodococcus (in: high G+C Gram-positive bacteria) TaxID=192944 RepID=UPI0036466391
MHKRTIAAFAAALLLPLSGPAVGHAQPSPQTAVIDRVESITDTRTALFVFSPSMGKVIQVQVLHPAWDGPRPTLYLLDGVSAGAESEYRESTWTQETDIVDFVADKNVNVVLPVGGTASYYTDWQHPDPILGVNQWETFLTEELPPIIDARFNGNGTNAVAGLSMGATAAMMLITRNPELYEGVAALSGCLDTQQDSTRNSVRATVVYKGGNPDNMWGPPDDPDWAAHDPYVHADQLRGKEVFISTGNGLLGPHDFASVDEPMSTGVPLEMGAFVCTLTFDRRLRDLHIPATVVYRPWGTHSWGYWQDDIKTAWPTLEDALGL